MRMTESERKWLTALSLITLIAFIPMAVIYIQFLYVAITSGFTENTFDPQPRQHYSIDILEECSYEGGELPDNLPYVLGAEASLPEGKV